jgi:hypothetical protein
MELLALEILKTFAVGDDGSRIRLVAVNWQQVFLASLVFALAVVQPGDLVVYIDSHSVWITDESDRI